jgi:catechol 2,3-dioxygenase-like lactoylglutathione lyase family enzyme
MTGRLAASTCQVDSEGPYRVKGCAMTETGPAVPQLAGVHHLKLPVRDLQRSAAWYERTLGYTPVMEFVEQGQLMGLVLNHPNGGPQLALRLDPQRAESSAGFDYFSIGVPTHDALDILAARLDRLGEAHAGVHQTPVGWILPMLHDPDGHEVRFYTIERPDGAPHADEKVRMHDGGPDARFERA